MENFIKFFRDTLSGSLYVIVTIICAILICACIGYLAEKRIKKKKERAKYAEVFNDLEDDNLTNVDLSDDNLDLQNINSNDENINNPTVVSSVSISPIQEVVEQNNINEVVTSDVTTNNN